MKKYHIVLSCLTLIMAGCCINRPIFDQQNGNVHFGPETSIRTSGFWGEDVQDSDYKHIGSVGFGGFLEWFFCDDYPDASFMTGMYFNQFGGKIVHGDGDFTYTDKTRLSYFTFPFTGTYRFYDNFRVEAGPEFSFLLGTKNVTEIGGQKNITRNTEDFRNVQIGFNVGLAYMHPEAGIGGFARYNGGINRLSAVNDDFKSYNGGLSLGVRYNLNNLLK